VNVEKNMNNNATIAPGDLTQELLTTSVWSDQHVANAGIPIVDVPFVTVGGGMGSFVMADFLRIAGVPATSIKSLSNIQAPWQSYEYLTRNSQIPRHERIRSDSSGCPDNIWAFPSYAVREAWQDKTLAPLTEGWPGIQLPRPGGEPHWIPGHAGSRSGAHGAPSS
jgi:hypothetical protein